MLTSLILIGLLLPSPPDGAVGAKEKNDHIIVKDKSKPVRRALALQYARLAEAVEKRDLAAFQALRTDDFHTVDEQGRPRSPQQMADRAKAMLESIQPPIRVSHTIGTIDVHGNDATATVRQYFSKMLDVAGKLRRIDTYVTQDETWTLTEDGWKLRFVDNVRDPETYVDGERFEPGRPHDPDAPPLGSERAASMRVRATGRVVTRGGSRRITGDSRRATTAGADDGTGQCSTPRTHPAGIERESCTGIIG